MLLGIVLSNTVLNDPLGFDFSIIYAAGTILRKGDASKLYDLGVQAQVERSFGRRKLLIYDHPPFEAILFEPITNLSYTTAYILWGLINVLLWLLFQAVFRPFAPVPKNDLHYFLLCSLFFPLWSGLMQGQMSMLLLLVFSLTFVHLERRQDYRAGVFLGLGLFKFPVVIPFALICFLRSKWKMMMGFATAAVLLTALSLLVVGPVGAISYVRMLAAATARSGAPAYTTLPWDMPSLTGFLMTFLVSRISPRSIEATAAILGGILLLATARVWRRHDKLADGDSSGLMFAAALTLSLVTAPYLNLHDLSLMLLAVFLVLGSSQWASGSRWTVVLKTCIWILYIPPVYVLLLRHSKMSLLFPVLLCFALAALLLAVNSLPRTSSPEAGGAAGAVIASGSARNCDTC